MAMVGVITSYLTGQYFFDPFVLLSGRRVGRRLPHMARYQALMGKRVEVQYRAGDLYLPATAVLTADSGKSIFLEEHIHQGGRVKAFRWEIPYPSIVRISACAELEKSASA